MDDPRLDLYGTDKSGNFGHAGRPGQIGGSAPEQATTAPKGREPNPAPYGHVLDPPTPNAPLGRGRPTPILAKSLDEAVALILKGKVVELEDVETVHTVLAKLAKIARHAEKKGKDAPKYDLCKVSVAGTNLFCGSSLKTDKFPKGIPRIKMPQLSGEPKPGSEADKLPKNKKGSVNAAEAFLAHLQADGITVKDKTMPAAKLRATQSQLVGAKVAGMMKDKKFDPHDESIFVSRDGYVLDGHHRWAAVVGRDAKDGKLGNAKMKVRVVDAPIAELLVRAKAFTKQYGIRVKGTGKSKKTALAMIFDGDIILLPYREKLMKLSDKWTPES